MKFPEIKYELDDYVLCKVGDREIAGQIASVEWGNGWYYYMFNTEDGIPRKVLEDNIVRQIFK